MSPKMWNTLRPSLVGLGLALAASLVIADATHAQSRSCVLTLDKRNPDDLILHCGATLTVKPAPGTVYHPPGAGESGPPRSIQRTHPTRTAGTADTAGFFDYAAIVVASRRAFQCQGSSSSICFAG
jgi:hypothetical protein